MPETAQARTAPVCSARGCRAQASWALRWNNPRLHDPQRRKVWMACESHRAGLSDFLGIRGFLRETQPVDRVIDLDSGRTVTPVADASAPV